MFDYNITCAFSGYRPAKLPCGGDESSPEMKRIAGAAERAIESAAQDGYRIFLCGMAMGFDILCGELVARRKAFDPALQLKAVIPYNGQCSRWNTEYRQRYYDLLKKCDDFVIISENYFDGCYFVRNKYLVDHASRLIAYYDGLPGGTKNTVKYAQKRAIDIVNIAVDEKKAAAL